MDEGSPVVSPQTRTAVEPRPRRPWVTMVTPDALTHFAWSIGDANPLWVDGVHAAGSRWGGLIAPPCFLYAVDETTVAPGHEGRERVYTNVAWTWFDAIHAGDELAVDLVLIEETETEWRRERGVPIQVGEARFSRVGGPLIATARTRCARPTPADETLTDIEDRSEHWYTSEELEAIEIDVLSETPRGADDRIWEDVQVGDPVGSVVKGPLSVMDVVAWHAGTQGVSAQPLGHSTGGLSEGRATGPQFVSWAANAVTNWVGDNGFVHRLTVEMDELVPLGDTTWWQGEVVSTPTVGERPLVELVLRSVNQLGTSIGRGTAIVALPSREYGPVALPMEYTR